VGDSKLDHLRRVPLFAGIRGRELDELGRLADEIDVPDGKVLTREGETGHEFFIVQDGLVEVTVGGGRVA
jgi:CRP-like cAMP-binding protein